MNATASPVLNGLNADDLNALIASTRADAAAAQTRWTVTTKWVGGTVSEARVLGCTIGGKRCPKDFTIVSDEPRELGGNDTQPNPQEYLLAALNACMTVGYVAGATLMGIELESLEIDTTGDIDLRGFLGVDPSVKPGYESLNYSVRIKGNGTPEQFEQLHQIVMKTSPNRFNLSQPVRLNAKLIVK